MYKFAEHRTFWMAVGVVVPLAFLLGWFLSTVQNKRGRPDFFETLVSDVVTEMCAERRLGLTIGQQSEFLGRNDSLLRTVYEEAEREEIESNIALRTFLETHYSSNEVEGFCLDSPFGVEYLIAITPQYDDGLKTVIIDPADWPDFFLPTRFGFGARNAIKEAVDDLFDKAALITGSNSGQGYFHKHSDGHRHQHGVEHP